MSGAGWGLTGPLKARWDVDHSAICALLVADGWEILPSVAPLAVGDQAMGTILGHRGDDEVVVGLSVAVGGGGTPRTVGNPGCAVHKAPGRGLTVQVNQSLLGEALARPLLAGRAVARLDAAAIDAAWAAEGFVNDPDERRELIEDSAIGPLVRVTGLARRADVFVFVDLFAYPEEVRVDASQVAARERGAFTVQEGESSLLVRAGDTAQATALMGRLLATLPPADVPFWRRWLGRLGLAEA